MLLGRQSLLRSWTPSARTRRVCLAVSIVATYHVGQINSHAKASVITPERHRRSGSFATPIRAIGSQQQQVQQSPDEWQLFRIGGDGNCMFRAAVQGAHWARTGRLLAPREETQAAMKLRQDVVQELQKRRSDMEPFIMGIMDDFGTNTYDAYLQRMAQPSTWGGEPEVSMAAHVLRCPIRVWSAAQGLDRPNVVHGEEYFALSDGDDYIAGACDASSPPAAAAAVARTAVVPKARMPTNPPMDLLWSGNHYDLLIPPASSGLSSQGSD